MNRRFHTSKLSLIAPLLVVLGGCSVQIGGEENRMHSPPSSTDARPLLFAVPEGELPTVAIPLDVATRDELLEYHDECRENEQRAQVWMDDLESQLQERDRELVTLKQSQNCQGVWLTIAWGAMLLQSVGLIFCFHSLGY